MRAPRRVDRYEILAQLSTGGMGTVHLARRSVAGVETLCALKTVKAELAESAAFRTMFLDEVRLLSKLRHPAIAQLFEVGEAGGVLYVALELVRGVPFTRFTGGKLGPPPPGVAARLVAAACRGLHAAHELTTDDGRPLGVVHRDVSPQNLMLSFDGFVKVLDFGIALAAERGVQPTQLGEVKGKPAYMAPEQLEGAPQDRRTDVYGASVVLHELLTGKPLFEGSSVLAVALAINEGRVTPPSRAVPGLDPRYDAIVMKGLAVRPADRYATARELAEALEALADASGAETLEAFAARSLVEERKGFDAKLAQARGEADALPPAGSEGRETVQERTPRLARSGLSSLWRSRRAAALGLTASVLAVAGAAAFWLIGTSPRPAAPPPPAIATLPPPSAEPPKAAEPPRPPEPAPVEAARPAARPKSGRRNTPAPAAAPVAYGLLSVDAHPYGRVRVDGAELGETPRLDVRMPAGRHQVELISPVDGTVREARTVEVKPDGHERVMFGTR